MKLDMTKFGMCPRHGHHTGRICPICPQPGHVTPHEACNTSEIPNTQPERDEAPALGRPIQGEASRIPRIIVRFAGYRVKPLDPDNYAGSVKDLLDGLRHAGLIPGDEPWRITLETEQEKVAHYADEKTVIEITTHEK